MPSSDDSSPNKDHRVSRGHSYEKLAGKFFQQQGFEIIERNWRTGHLEIDLIVQQENLIVFVEVKSSSSQEYGHPAQRVNKKKIGNLSRAAQQYLIDHNIENSDLRFDVVTFTAGQLEHYPNAFEADY